jgi:hypothetical protein
MTGVMRVRSVRPDRIGRWHGTALAGGVVIEAGDDYATR